MNIIFNEEEIFKNEMSENGYLLKEIIEINWYYRKAVFIKNNKLYTLKIVNKKRFYDNKNLNFSVSKEIQVGKKIGNKNKYLLGFFEEFITKHYLVLVYEYIKKGNLLKFKQKYISKNKKFSIWNLLLILKDWLRSVKEWKKINIINVNINIENVFIKENYLIVGGYENCFFNSRYYSNINYFFYKNNIINEFKYIAPEFLINNNLSYVNVIYSLGILILNLFSKTNSIKKKIIFQNNNYVFLFNKIEVKRFLNNNFSHENFKLKNKFNLILNYLIEPDYKCRIKLNLLNKFLSDYYSKIQFKYKEILLRAELFELMGNQMSNLKRESLINLNNFSIKKKTTLLNLNDSSLSNKKFKFNISNFSPQYKKKINYYIPKKVKLTNNFFLSYTKKS